MKNYLLFLSICCISIGIANAAVRDANTITRTSGTNNIQTATAGKQTVSRNSIKTNAISRSATVSPRNKATSGPATSARDTAMISRSAVPLTISRDTDYQNAKSANTIRPTYNTQRATTLGPTSLNLETGYNSCRDAYFTCMDQFCANQDDTYRRCVCSSRLSEIKSKQSALKQTGVQLQDFKDLNIEVISKTSNEVNAMLTASAGELSATTTTGTSSSASQLNGIRDVLSDVKTKALSTLGTLDIAGDINNIWATSSLTGGTNISNLTGESLYNAVHSQCVDLIKDNCSSTSTLNMVISAYGMYIENDCTTLSNSLDKSLASANSNIRATEKEMHQSRLDNYDAMNSTSINDCVSNVRSDILQDTACGPNYVHCLDITGKYLNKDTGEPIYSASFYQLQHTLSLSGDILTNSNNRLFVTELDKKRIFAQNSLKTCSDASDDAWDEFMRQAVTEIYQIQQAKIREVKTECLDIVNQCYDEQSESLKDFSNTNEQLLIGSRLELSEKMCEEKMLACSNVYGDGAGNGLELLLSAMHNITDQKIAQNCSTALLDFAQDLCSVPSNDTLHSYPYSCRVYAPGEQQYASIAICNITTDQSSIPSGTYDDTTQNTPSYSPELSENTCLVFKEYTKCKFGYYLATSNGVFSPTPESGNQCKACDTGFICEGGTSEPIAIEEKNTKCGNDYIGSLYQKMVRYAMQTCVRPSDTKDQLYTLPETVLSDVNIAINNIKISMAASLSAECTRLGGIWVDTPWTDEVPNASDPKSTDALYGDKIHDITNQTLYKKFYEETGANTKWGYCTTISETATDGN